MHLTSTTTIREANNSIDNQPPQWNEPRSIPACMMESGGDSRCLYRAIQTFKATVYILAFLIVLTGASFSQLGIAVITSQMTLSGDTSTRILWNYAALTVLAAPRIFLFIKCVFKRHRSKSPSFSTFLVIGGGEVLKALGNGLLVFQVLPDTPALLVPLIFLTFSWGPGLIRSFTFDNNGIRFYFCKKSLFIMIASIVLLFVGLFMYMLMFADHSRSPSYFILLTLAVFLSSLSWWPSFFDPNYEDESDIMPVVLAQDSALTQPKGLSTDCFQCFSCFTNTGCTHYLCSWSGIKNAKSKIPAIVHQLETSRYYLYIYISIIQILIYALLCNVLLPKPLIFNFAKYSDAFGQFQSKIYQLWWVIINVAGSYLAYAVGRSMCKVSMQLVSFSIPLTLTPLVVVIVLYVCELKAAVEDDPTMAYLINTKFPKFMTIHQWPGIVVWFILILFMICQTIIGSYIFKSPSIKYSKADSLFTVPFYEGACLVQSLIFSRKLRDSKASAERQLPCPKTCPKIYMCATMWHETVEEMQQLFVSIFRTDLHQASIKRKNRKANSRTSDEYNFELHILFDDAFETRLNENTNQYERIVNKFVIGLMEAIQNSSNIVLKTKRSVLRDPVRFITPYGGQLVLMTPGHNPIFVHLKDKTKIRNKKRWSQIMYLYYLLTYKENLQLKFSKNNNRSDFHKPFHKKLKPQYLQRLKNTFILTLDGDIDWKPTAIQLLLNDLLRNEQTAAVCARIIPSGSGPFVWYQSIEYAAQHWLSKTMENTFGCVLCAPGCFSLFRASALVDDNVMKAYAKKADEASELVQYDQGEDRWLCTLLLKCRSGYRVNYCAASTAIASSPTSFSEFLNQRRRWIPSSLMNHFDFVKNGRSIAKNNSNINLFYIIVQVINLVGTIVGPSFIIIYMPSALTFSGIALKAAYVIIVLPVAIHLTICLICSKDTQIKWTAIISLIMALFFTMALATSVFAVIQNSDNYANYLIVVITGVIIVSGILHPLEVFNLMYLVFYIVGTPIMFLLFFNYALCNINDMGWGTREVATNTDDPKQANIISRTFDAILRWWNRLIDPDSRIRQQRSDARLLEEGEARTPLLQNGTNITIEGNSTDLPHTTQAQMDGLRVRNDEEAKKALAEHSKDPNMPWSEDDPQFRHQNHYRLNRLPEKDVQFWEEFIDAYLKPINTSDSEKENMKALLTDFRNQIVTGYLVLTCLIVFTQYQIATLGDFYKFKISISMGSNYLSVDYLTLCLIIIYSFIIILQILGMLYHRLGTLMEYLSITKLGRFQTSPNVTTFFEPSVEAVYNHTFNGLLIPECDINIDEAVDTYDKDQAKTIGARAIDTDDSDLYVSAPSTPVQFERYRSRENIDNHGPDNQNGLPASAI